MGGGGHWTQGKASVGVEGLLEQEPPCAGLSCREREVWAVQGGLSQGGWC